MRIVLIQVLLIVVVVAVAARLFRSRGARAQALRRIGLLLFAAGAVISILVPDLWNRLARIAGVGRGTDMVLYALVVAFLSYTVTTYLRFRELETRFTKLARRLAIDEAQATQSLHAAHDSPSADDPTRHTSPAADDPGEPS